MATDTPIYDRTAVADLMALVDAYADTACSNGIRSGWAQMARAAVEAALIKERAQPAPAASPAPVVAREPLTVLASMHPTFKEFAPGIEIGYDILGGADIRLGGEFVYVHINYNYAYTDNASRKALAEKIASILATPSREMPDLTTLAERGKEAWTGVDPQKLRETGAL